MVRALLILAFCGGFAHASTAATPTHIVFVLGQSNANQAGADGIYSDRQDGGSVMFETQTLIDARDGGCGVGSTSWMPTDAGDLVPLIETERERPRAGIANASRIFRSHGAIVVTVAWGGYRIACLKKGTVPWSNVISAWENLKRVGAIKNHGTDATISVVWVQGEQDEIDQTAVATYQLELEYIQNQFQELAGLYVKLPLERPIRWIMVQAQSWTYGTSQTTPKAAIAQYNFARAYPDRAVIALPTYPLEPAAGNEIHRSPLGVCQTGAILDDVIHDPSFPGFMPNAAPVLSGSTITATFSIPTCPAVFDTTTVTGVSTLTRGFEYDCTSSPPPINGVTNTSCSNGVLTLTFALDGDPDATCESNDVIRYAYTGGLGALPGPTTGPRGNIRDSSPGTFNCGATAVPKHKWLVTFSESVSGS